MGGCCVLPPAAGTSDPCCRGTSWPAGFNPLARGWSKHCHWERTTVLQKPKHAEQGHQHHIYVDASDTELLTDGFRTQLATGAVAVSQSADDCAGGEHRWQHRTKHTRHMNSCCAIHGAVLSTTRRVPQAPDRAHACSVLHMPCLRSGGTRGNR